MNNKLQSTFLTIALILSAFSVSAQDKLLSIEDCFNPKYYPQSLRSVQWIPNSHKFSQVIGTNLIATDPYSRKNDTLVTREALVRAVSEAGGTLKNLPSITWKDENSFWFIADNKVYIYFLSTGTATQKRSFGTSYDAIEISSSNLNVSTVENNNLYVHTISGSRKVTEDGGNGIVYGQAVHQREFGIMGGMFWSAQGNKLAFYRMDERRVTQYPIYNINDRPASESKIKYPMTGDSSHTVSVGVYNVETEELIYLKTEGPYDQYLTNVTWSPDGDYIYIAWLNRDQNHMQLRKYNSHTGVLEKVLFEEKHEKYVEPEHGPLFLPGSNSDFIWFSERDGFDHLYQYQNGKPARQLTSGNWEVTEIIGFDRTGEILYFEATKDSPLERHAYSIRVRDKEPKIKKVTSGIGTHKIWLNSYSGLFMDMYTSRREPRKYTVYKTDGGTLVSEVFKSTNPLEEFDLGEVKIDPVIIAGNTALYTRTFLPNQFDATKKYPVIVYVYGGPHAQMITESWLGGANLWFHYMAQNGYIVYTVDNRGSAHKGLNFENATFRQLGTVEMQDQIAALNHLKRMPYVDSNRIGVHGWSFGGFMTTTMMTKSPETFKVGVAGGPVIDWKYYEIMYTERYMDKPQDNPAGYENANLLKFAGNLRGRLLMIHGTDDDVVLWQHSMLYVKQMVKEMNANLDYYIYPGHKHNVIGPDRAHLYKKISQYFFDYL